MWKQSNVCESFENNLINQTKQLSSLKFDRSPSVHLYNNQLDLIFHTLYYANDVNIFEAREYSDEFLDELQRLARICLEVIDSQESLDHGPIEKAHMECRIWAHKILIFLTRKPYVIGNEKIRRMIYNSLVNKLHIPEYDELILRRMKATRRVGLSAYCLSQASFDDIPSPEDASRLIADKLLPLAAKFLNEEAKCVRETYQLFLDHFHDRYGMSMSEVLCNESFCTYRLLIHLLSASTKRSESGLQNCELIFESMLKKAIGRGSINDEDVVALNIILINHKGTLVESRGSLFMDLLAKSRGIHRAHITYLCQRILRSYEYERFFVKTLVEDLVTNNDELMNEISVRILRQMRFEIPLWEGVLTGKECRLIDKLIDMNVAPGFYLTFLEKFSEFDERDSYSSISFDNLAFRPISRIINELYHWINFRKNNHVDGYHFLDSLRCLQCIVRLRKHRLDPSQEMKLNQVFGVIIKERIRYNNGDYLLFANSFRVYPNAWKSILETMRLALTIELPADYLRFRMSNSQELALDWLLITNQVFSHLLITDADYFYTEIASPEILELIYKYSERAIELGFVDTLIKEVLLTWPQKSQLIPEEHQAMPSKFVKLLIKGLEKAEKDSLTPREYPSDELYGLKSRFEGLEGDKLFAKLAEIIDLREDDKMGELLFGLAAAFGFHREALHSVLDKLGSEYDLENRDLWLKENILRWTKLVIDDGKQRWPGEWYFYGLTLSKTPQDWRPSVRLDRFANVVVASEVFTAINEYSQAHHELRESSKGMSEVIKSALDRGLKRAPIGSIESTRYEQLRDCLPNNQFSS